MSSGATCPDERHSAEPPAADGPEPSVLFAHVVRSHAEAIVAVAASADEGVWVGLDVADPFVDLLDDPPPEAAHLAHQPAAVRLLVRWSPPSGGTWTLAALYSAEDDVPERPAAWEWTWAIPCPLPSLRHAPGLAPLDPETLASWALASGDAQARAASALVIEACVGLTHTEHGAAEALFGSIPGLAWHMENCFDAEHREAVGWVLAWREVFGRVEGRATREEPSEETAPLAPAPEPERRPASEPTTIETALRSEVGDGWSRPMRADRRRVTSGAVAA